MMKWISATYETPSARVRANGVISDSFPITNGTRQGCPLSPLLFALSLEPFLCHVRLNPNIRGVKIGQTQHKVSAYADDLMFSLTNPSISLPNLLREFATYGALSNLKINFAKSEAMGVGIPENQLEHLQSSFKFKWTTNALKYLGTLIPQTFTRIYDLNFPPLLKSIKALLTKWHTGLHSWIGRCKILKMMILPKFLYLMQALPTHIPTSYFKQIQSTFTNFIWAKRRPRISHKLLVLPKQHGGLAVPDVRMYYKAIHLGRLIDWRRHQESKLWTQIEQTQCEIHLNRAPWCYTCLPTDIKQHPLIGNTSKICAQIISKSPLSSSNSPLYPILENPRFLPGVEDVVFRRLGETGRFQASHFSVAGRWYTIAELSDPVGPFRLDFLRARQLGHFLHSLKPPVHNEQSLTTLEELCNTSGTITHTLSLTYSLLNTPQEDFIPPGILKCERELNCHFNTTKRQHILKFTHKSSICAKIQETNYKIMTRWYRTPALLHKLFPATSDLCWLCGADRGTLNPIFWSCPASFLANDTKSRSKIY